MKKSPLIKKAITLIILGFATTASADILSVHCPIGCPSNPAGNDLVFSHVYALSNNPTTKFADWVAYEVDVVNFGDSPGRTWASEPLLDDSETLEKDDYIGANKALSVDRGHQAPLASFAGSRYWSELNYLSNITPQAKDLNKGPWKHLEVAVRNAVSYRDSLYVITGPLYEGDTTPLPKADESHKIPSGYFKIIYKDDGSATGFVMNQKTALAEAYCTKNVPITDIERKTAFKLPAFTESSSVLKGLNC